MKIGFIGTGFIGGNMSKDFEERDYEVVRYSLEPEFSINRDRIKDCDITFIAVPTPTTPVGFDLSIVDSALDLIGDGKIAVIKSTILPGSTIELQLKHSKIKVLHSPEFLREKFAYEDCKNPERNIIGIPVEHPTEEDVLVAEKVLNVLPKSKYALITTSNNSEMIKYVGNYFLFMKVIFANMMYDITKEIGGDWDVVKNAAGSDPRVGLSHMDISADGGRGAGGHCFIKDAEALLKFYNSTVHDLLGLTVMSSLRNKNIDLLLKSGKDIDLLKGVYGENIINYRGNGVQ